MQRLLIGALLVCTYSASCQSSEVPARLSEVKMIADNEPGKPFTLELTVLDLTNKAPIKDVEVFAYHTNYKGDYENDSKGVARIHGTAYSNEKGWMRFITIYPRGYNNTDFGEHIHFRVKAKGYSSGGADLSFWDYQRKRYDLDNPVANRVYLQTLDEKDGKLTGTAILYLKK